MNTGPTLKEQQLAWAIAWQDHGDRAALARLCESVRGLVLQELGRTAKNTDAREELLAEYWLAVVEAATAYDRNRPDGFVVLCGFYMRDRARRVYRRMASPVTASIHSKDFGRGVSISAGDDDGLVVQLEAPEAYSESVPGAGVLEQAIDVAGLTAKEWRAVHRFQRGETQEQLGEIWGCVPQGVAYHEKTALAKIRAVLQARGLSLEDLL